MAEVQVQWMLGDPYIMYDLQDQVGDFHGSPIYRATRKNTTEHFLVKQIALKSNKVRKAANRELGIGIAQSNEYVVKYYQGFQEKTRCYLVSEWMDFTLYDVLQKTKKIPENMIIYILHWLLKGLEKFHDEARIHRDVQSNNIYIDRTGNVKLGGLGMSVQLSNTKTYCSSQTGSLCWMAPELISGPYYQQTVDIWSAGITALEMTNGMPPFLHEDPEEVMLNILTDEPPAVKKPEKWSSNLNELISMLLTKSPDCRPTAGQLLEHHRLFTPADIIGKLEFANWINDIVG